MLSTSIRGGLPVGYRTGYIADRDHIYKEGGVAMSRIIYVMALIAMFSFVAEAGAGELRSFDPLGGGANIAPERKNVQKPRDTREDFIRDFEKIVSKMSNKELIKLRDELKIKYEKAKDDGNTEHERFIARLLSIVALNFN